MTEFIIRPVLERAMRNRVISAQEWEAIIELATEQEDVVLNGEKNSLERLVRLLEGGIVGVEGVPQQEIISRLAVFA